ncbi:MAG: hypothetical protein WC764_03160 [Candidatus Paceibacterota bacterium]|jgi:hypothetical protein
MSSRKLNSILLVLERESVAGNTRNAFTERLEASEFLPHGLLMFISPVVEEACNNLSAELGRPDIISRLKALPSGEVSIAKAAEMLDEDLGSARE